MFCFFFFFFFFLSFLLFLLDSLFSSVFFFFFSTTIFSSLPSLPSGAREKEEDKGDDQQQQQQQHTPNASTRDPKVSARSFREARVKDRSATFSFEAKRNTPKGRFVFVVLVLFLLVWFGLVFCCLSYSFCLILFVLLFFFYQSCSRIKCSCN